MGKQNETDDHPAYQVAKDYLQKLQVGVVGQSGDADDGERAGFGSDNRKSNRPPRNIAVGEEIVLQRALAFAKTKAKQSYAGQVNRNNKEVNFVQSHDSCANQQRFLAG